MMFKKTFNAQKLASLRSVINTCQADTLLSIISFIISFFSMFKISSLTIVYCLCGTPAIIRTIKEIKEKSLSIDSLMTVAGIASCIIGNEIEGALLFLLFQIAKEMEEKIKEKSKNSILDTSRLLPNKTWIIRENKEISPRHISDVEIGSEILISPGEVVPLDGVIIKGNTVVTTAHLTGEPTEFSKSPGDILLSGSNNISSTVIIKTTKLSSESTLNRMINLMQTAAEISTEGQTWMESMKNRYALAVIFSCFIVSICAPLLIDIPYLGSNGSIHRALSTLIALSPCAMLIAIPICYVSSSNSYTERGVLLRNSKALNALAKMKTIAFDKTGTLTHPTLSITSITCWSSSGKESSVTQETIRRIVSLETQVMHPMSTAILNWGYKILTTINLHKIYSIRTVPGKGICGDLENGSIQIAIGELEFIKPFVPRELHTAIIETKSNNSMCWAWTGDQLIFFTFSETLRSGVEELFESFKNKRIKTIILSGDKYQNANNLCGHLKGTKILAELTPEEKLNIITELKKEGPIVMVGDGLNDGPAMLSADASIAMGGMSHHITTENSDIVILDDRIDKLNWIIEKAKKTRIIVAQNVFLAITSIAIGAIFAILGKTSLWVAVLLHEGSTILVSMNGIRLLW